MYKKVLPLVLVFLLILGAIGGVSAKQDQGQKVVITNVVWDGNDLLVTLCNEDNVNRDYLLNLANNADGHDGTVPISGNILGEATKIVTIKDAPTDYKFVVVNTVDPGLKDRNDKANIPDKPVVPDDPGNETNETDNNGTTNNVTPTNPDTIIPGKGVAENKTIPMQTTGYPLNGAVVGILSILGGVGLATKIRFGL